MRRPFSPAEQEAADKYAEKLEAEVKILRAAVQAADRFFREAMPMLNVKGSAIDANGIDAWNKAEIAVAQAMKAKS